MGAVGAVDQTDLAALCSGGIDGRSTAECTAAQGQNFQSQRRGGVRSAADRQPRPARALSPRRPPPADGDPASCLHNATLSVEATSWSG